MKKYLLITSFASLLIAAPAYAATISVTPTSVVVTAGQQVTLTLTAQAGTDTLVTVQSDLSYPTNLLEPTSFNIAPTWVPITETGYDQMSGGTVIKTGGYPGGFTGNQVLGTLTFKALTSGVATVSVTNDSAVLDQNGNNALSGTQGSATVTISGTSNQNQGGTTVTTTSTTTTSGTGTNGAVNSAAAANALGSASTTNGVNQAAAAGLLGLNIPSWVWALLLLIILAIAAGSWWYWGNKKA